MDTVKIDHEKGIVLTDCIKHTKDVLFFLNPESEAEEAKPKAPKKAPAKPATHAQPLPGRSLGACTCCRLLATLCAENGLMEGQSLVFAC